MKDFSAKAYREKLKKNGVFHTDEKLAKILKSYGKERPRNVYDPTCGNGVLLSVFDDDIPKFGQELQEEYLDACREGLKNFKGALGDVLKNPAFMDKKFDFIIANPPFSVKWVPVRDVRFEEYDVLAPKSKADFAFLMHMLYLLDKDGIIVTLGFPGICYRKASEEKIRREFIEKGYIKRVILVPGGHFEDTKIQTVILVLDKKNNKSIFFEDLEQSKTREVSIEEIRENNYNLSVHIYIQKEVVKETIDIDKLERELYVKKQKRQKLEDEIDNLIRTLRKGEGQWM